MYICVFGAASADIDEKYIKAVEEMGEFFAQRGHNLVFGAGGCGLMGAAADKRIVDDVDVAGVQIFPADLVHHGADHGGDHADEAGDAVALGQQPSVGIGNAACIVQSLIDDGTHGSLGKRVEDLVADRNQRILDNIQRYRIDRNFFSHYCTSISTIRLP